MRSTSEEQNRTCRRSHSRNAGPRSSPSARRSTIAARRRPLSSTSSVGITYTGGPSGRRVKRQCKRSVSLAAKLPTELVDRSEEHTSELQSQSNLVCRLLLAKKKTASKI